MDASAKISRRNFIKTGAAFGGLTLLGHLPLDAFAGDAVTKITILHTNDWHSRIEPFPADGGRYAGMGGAAVRAALIEKIRSEEKHVLLLDAGDIFQGTPYFNFFEGELEYKLMSRMGYDLATLGNHDFDNGIEGILKQLPHATFGFVNCNYDFSRTLLKDKIRPYKVFKKGGVRIGVLGVGVELKGLVPDKLYGETVYLDPVVHANAVAKELRTKERCDLVICLSHLGYEYANDKISDRKLAAQSSGIDVIIGGHTHTFLPEPVVLKNADSKDVIINQVGWAGLQMGKLDFYFNASKNTINKGIGSNLDILRNKG